MRNYLFIALSLLMLASCSRSGDAPRRPVVTVSIEPQRWLLERIAGDRLEVRSLMDKNSDPENFDPTVAALRDLESSRAYFMLGNNAFEAKTVSRLRQNGSKLRIVDTGKDVGLIYGTHDHDGHEHSAPDPHIWLSVKNMETMAVGMAEALAEIDPDGAPAYRAGLDSLRAELSRLDRRLTQQLLPLRGSAFLVRHPAMSYFARDYGLRQIALGTEGKETTPAAMARQLDEARASGAAVMLLQPADNEDRSEAVAREIGARTATVNTLDYDWPRTMQSVADALTRSRSARNGSANDRSGASGRQ